VGGRDVFSRILAEFILIVFRINEHLGAIRDQAACGRVQSSWPGLSRPSTSFLRAPKTWMPATSAGMTRQISSQTYVLNRKCMTSPLATT